MSQWVSFWQAFQWLDLGPIKTWESFKKNQFFSLPWAGCVSQKSKWHCETASLSGRLGFMFSSTLSNSTTSTTYCIYKVSPMITFLLSRHLVPPAVCTRPNPIPCFPSLGCTNIRTNSFVQMFTKVCKTIIFALSWANSEIKWIYQVLQPIYKSGSI